ncbi:ClC family H(+)/Cl(-) exchange transporter [Loigolactobacillus rennini]|uniref:Chloride channel protein n=1 Tax=Loigolactobacillus rennini DSM 20253 TaxID=1423796 RepID=A0A0R2D4A9_9LACO|nr:ClC family H(+)/Cl(-) exchange transporter [Loigolactobacillus rennini]KRM98743.1 chloride channel protein [Loigolactobacillus rennini DSM 20253]
MAFWRQIKHFDTTRFKFILKGLLIGLVSGIVVSFFRLAIEIGLQKTLRLYQWLHVHPMGILGLIIASIILAFIIGVIVKGEPNIMGSGIPQVEGQLAGDIALPWWSILWRKFTTGILGIAPGLFLGREGPSIQLGAAVGQGIATKLGRSDSEKRIMLASGAAAGLSAAFSAPIAGTLFVLEEIYHNFSPLIWMTSLASAIAADFVSLNFFGLTPVLHIQYSHSFPLALYWQLILLGAILGVFGYLYQCVLLAMPGWYSHLKWLPRSFQGVVPLLLVIPLGYFWPQTLGGGNAVILGLAVKLPPFWPLLALFLIRFIFSMISYGSGLPGGIFLPILTLGALLGALLGTLFASWQWMPQVYIMNFVIFAMAGYFAGIGKAPFTAILLITEMVGDLRHLMPLAVVSLVAYVVVDLLGGAPIYESLLARLNFGRKLNQMSRKNDRLEFPVFAGSALEDKQVRDVKWPHSSLLIAVRRQNRVLIPHGDTLLRAGDTLIVLMPHAKRGAVRRRLRQITATSKNLQT